MELEANNMCYLLIHGGTENYINELETTLEQFNLFAFILHQPNTHLDFNSKLIELIDRLDLITGDRLLFFAALEPNENWANRFREREYFNKLKSWKSKMDSGYTMYPAEEEAIEVIAHELNIPLESLPCIVVFNNIKAKTCRWYQTNPGTIEDQLYRLGRVASEHPEIKNNWRFAGHVLERNKSSINLCANSESEFLEGKDVYQADPIKPVEPSLAALIEKENPSLEDKENVFQLVDRNWYIKFKGVSTILFNNKKIRYVVHLLERPGIHVKNKELVNEFISNEEETSDIEENLTKKQKKIIKETVNELLEKLKEAQDINDNEQIKEIKQDINAIEKTLREVYKAELTISEKNKATIKARESVLSKDAKNARVNVKNNLNNAFKDIAKDLPELERHLIQCIDTHTTYAVYDPAKAKADKSIEWFISW